MVAPPPAGPVVTRGLRRITGVLKDGSVGGEEPDEFVEITNVGDGAVDLTGWRLESEKRGNDSGQVFCFPASLVMQPGKVCRIYTNQDHPEWCGLSFRRSQAVWNNSEPDAAGLVDSGGNVVARWE